REHDELGDTKLRDVLEQLGEAGHVPRVVLGRRCPRVVHDPEVHDRRDVSRPEYVFELLPANVDLGVLDVFRLVEKGASIDADDGSLAVQHARELLAEATADAGDEHRAAGGGRDRRHPHARRGPKVRALAHRIVTGAITRRISAPITSPITRIYAFVP